LVPRISPTVAALGLFALGAVTTIVSPAGGGPSALAAGIALAAYGSLAGLAVWLAHARVEAETRSEVLEARVERLEQDAASFQGELDNLRTSDPVSGTLNRRAFLRRLAETIRRDQRLGRPLALVLVDVGHLAEITERFGGAGGEEALRKTAAALRAATRDTDFVGRFSACELGAVLAECDEPRRVVERFFETLSRESIGDDPPWPLTASAAVAIADKVVPGLELADFVQVAESTLRPVRTRAWGYDAVRVEPRRVPALR
jgi:diguanylate cyclase (GGDEF)-like protein